MSSSNRLNFLSSNKLNMYLPSTSVSTKNNCLLVLHFVYRLQEMLQFLPAPSTRCIPFIYIVPKEFTASQAFGHFIHYINYKITPYYVHDMSLRNIIFTFKFNQTLAHPTLVPRDVVQSMCSGLSQGISAKAYALS